MMNKKIIMNSKLGFTMVEMAIVIIILGLLTAALAPLLMQQHTNAMEDTDRKALAKAKDEIISYAIQNGGIPNPLNEFPAGSNPCTNIQINPLLPVPTTGVGMMPPPNALASTCANAVSSFDVNNWGAFGSINNVTANPLQTFQLDVSDALLSYSVTLPATTTTTLPAGAPTYTGGNPAVFCQAVQQQLRGGYCSDNATAMGACLGPLSWIPGGYCSNGVSQYPGPGLGSCTAAAATWISGGYCYNNASASIIASNTAVPLTPVTCPGYGSGGNTWYAAPQVCQDTTIDHYGAVAPNAACTSYSPAAFVLYSTGNDRIPNQGNDQGATKLGTNLNGAIRVYESDTRGINNGPNLNTGGVIDYSHYDDQVMSYPLSSLANDCQTKMNVSPEVMQCSPGQKALVVTNATGAPASFNTNANLYAPNQICTNLAIGASSSSFCQDRVATVSVYSNNGCVTLIRKSPPLSNYVGTTYPNYTSGKMNASFTLIPPITFN
jgi:prepilin-type N-terminal cleavage/methylation domain-containing protein